MSIAANAVADLARPPPPRAASNAADDPRDAPSFQDHVDVAYHAQPRDERAQPRTDTRPQAAQSQSRDQSSDRSDETTATDQPRQAEEEHADTKSDAAPTPISLQLIANAIAPIVGAKAAQVAPIQQQENAQATPASAQASALANAAAPVKVAPKADAEGRPAQVKTAKDATKKTEGASAPPAANAAPEIAASALQNETATPVTLAANLAAQDAVKKSGDAKSDAVAGIQAGPQHAASPRDPRQASPSTQAPPPAPETPLGANSSEAKPRDEGKALPLAEALKQASKDFAPTAPKAQPSSSTQPATMSAHPQLAALAEQGPTSAARTQAPPVALQVGGEIIRRFNGADTTFQLRLDPPDLGRVDVRLDVSRDHRVTAVFSADSPQALSDLARGARDLQQALQSAGLDLADDGLRFDLSSNGQGNAFAQAQAQQDQPGFGAANAALTETSIAPEIAAQRPLSIDSWRGGRVDLMA